MSDFALLTQLRKKEEKKRGYGVPDIERTFFPNHQSIANRSWEIKTADGDPSQNIDGTDTRDFFFFFKQKVNVLFRSRAVQISRIGLPMRSMVKLSVCFVMTIIVSGPASRKGPC